jgi:hypothetical protein
MAPRGNRAATIYMKLTSNNRKKGIAEQMRFDRR